MDMTTLTRAEVFEKYGDQLVRFATGIVGPSDSRDVVSAAMVSAMWSANWDLVDHERAYLYKAVLNEARQHLRRRERRRDAELKAVGGSPPGWIPEIRPEVLEAVGRLSVSQRAELDNLCGYNDEWTGSCRTDAAVWIGTWDNG
jgi:DNA-directed RNA polymerase specialized sigma24 family protein